MKQQFVFPTVLYFDQDNSNYVVAFPDIDVFTEGATVEDAFKSAKDYLTAYLKFSLHLQNDIEIASNYMDVKNNHVNDIVLLVDAEINSNVEEQKLASSNIDFDILDD